MDLLDLQSQNKNKPKPYPRVEEHRPMRRKPHNIIMSVQ